MLSEKVGGELLGGDAEFSSLSTDTRQMTEGAAYVALVGENFDGNEFLSQAESSGASAAIVSRQVDSPLPQLKVVDTHIALGDIAALNRDRSAAKIIALTGSQGKTSVKEMIGAILSGCGETLITEANLNNTIGVPLTLLKINDQHEYAVIEMGANSAGEIDFSARRAKPDIALITNASAAHIEGFGSLAGIVKAKGEIIDGLKADGVLVLNADDANVNEWLQRAKDKKTILYSIASEASKADYRAENIVMGARAEMSFTLCSPIGRCEIELSLLGTHNVANAVAAAAAAIEAGATLADVALGLRKLQPVQGRMCPVSGWAGSNLINDSYNASPSSFFAALDVLAILPGRRILLAGDMKELGAQSKAAHAAVGEYAAQSQGVELWAVGEQSKFTTEAFGTSARLFRNKGEMVVAAKDVAAAGVIFLVKGSRGAGMNSVVNDLTRGGET